MTSVPVLALGLIVLASAQSTTVINFEVPATGTTVSQWNDRDNWEMQAQGRWTPCAGETAALAERLDANFAPEPYYVSILGANATAGRITFSANSFIRFSAPLAGDNFLGIHISQEDDTDCKAGQTSTMAPTTTPSAAPTAVPTTPAPTVLGATQPRMVTDENGNFVTDANGERVTEGPALTSTSESDDSGGGGIVIAMSIIIALLLVVVGIMCYRQQAADGQKDGQRAVQTFENPAYEQANQPIPNEVTYAAFNANQTTSAPVSEAYDNTAGNQYSTVSSAGQSGHAGYLDVEASQHGGDVYAEAALATGDGMAANNGYATVNETTPPTYTTVEPTVEPTSTVYQFGDDDDTLEAIL